MLNLTVELAIIHIQRNSCKYICKQHLYIYAKIIYILYTAYIRGGETKTVCVIIIVQDCGFCLCSLYVF